VLGAPSAGCCCRYLRNGTRVAVLGNQNSQDNKFEHTKPIVPTQCLLSNTVYWSIPIHVSGRQIYHNTVGFEQRKEALSSATASDAAAPRATSLQCLQLVPQAAADNARHQGIFPSRNNFETHQSSHPRACCSYCRTFRHRRSW
jgi:hypothetical protein